LSKIFIVVCLG